MSLPATMAEAKQGRVYECEVPDCLYFMFSYNGESQ